MKATLNYGLNFIKHVDCGREVSKEAHKVLIEKQFKIVDFYCWLRKWEFYYLTNMEANGNISNLRWSAFKSISL